MEKRICCVCGGEVKRRNYSLPPEETRCRSCIGRANSMMRSRKNIGKKWPNQTSNCGYFYVRKPEHPNADVNGYVKRANLVWEETNNELMPDGYILHHKDMNRQNDGIENLQLVTPSEHARIHVKHNKNHIPIYVSPNLIFEEKLQEARKHMKLDDVILTDGREKWKKVRSAKDNYYRGMVKVPLWHKASYRMKNKDSKPRKNNNTFSVYVKKENGDMKLYLKDLTSAQAIKEADKYYADTDLSAFILREEYTNKQ